MWDFICDFCDGLIVVGTTLQTAMASSIVNKVSESAAPVVWVNLDSCPMRDGNRIVLQEKSEVALPALFDELLRLKKLAS